MRIECLMPFKEGRESFEKGDIFVVDDAKAAYFIKNGWAKEVDGPAPELAPADPVTLDVQNVGHKHKGVTRG